MKLSVLVRLDGKVIGTARHIDGPTDVHAALSPAVGHAVHEIEVPDEYEKLQPSELHERIRTIHLRNYCA
jgi:hypothetical protein